MKRIPITTLALVGLAGCAGTSPNLSSPQMQSPSLGNGSLAARSVAGLPRGASLEASYPVLEPLKTPEGTFVAPPYLQLESPTASGRAESLSVLWQCPSPTKTDAWSVEVRPARGGDWKKVAAALSVSEIKAEGGAARTALKAPLADLEPGELFDYQILQEGKPVFIARGRARRPARAAWRFVVLGEAAASKKLAYQAALARPDVACALGADADALWPVYNTDAAGADSGAPLLRSVPLVVAGGDPKALPLPGGKAGHASFDYGNAHWSVVDLAAAGDAAKAWLEKDLAAAKKATWRFVALHGAKPTDPWAKGLAETLQKGDVAAVFTSAHPGYLRSQPVKFAAPDSKITADTAFDGGKKSRASGMLYLVLGGAPPADAKADDTLPPYTAKRSDDAGSLTVADIDGKKLTVRQLSADGKEIDTFTVTR